MKNILRKGLMTFGKFMSATKKMKRSFIIFLLLCLLFFNSCSEESSGGSESTNVTQESPSVTQESPSQSSPAKIINLSSCGEPCAIAASNSGLFLALLENPYDNLGNLTILKVDDSFQPEYGIKVDLKKIFDTNLTSYVDLRFFSSDKDNNLYLYLMGGKIKEDGCVFWTEGYFLTIKYTNGNFTVSKILKFVPKEVVSLNSELDFQRVIVNDNSLYIEGPGLFWIFDEKFNLVDKFQI